MCANMQRSTQSLKKQRSNQECRKRGKNSSRRVGRFTSAASVRSFMEQNGANGMSDIEGKAARVAASERGQRVSFKATEFTKSGGSLQYGVAAGVSSAS